MPANTFSFWISYINSVSSIEVGTLRTPLLKGVLTESQRSRIPSVCHLQAAALVKFRGQRLLSSAGFHHSEEDVPIPTLNTTLDWLEKIGTVIPYGDNIDDYNVSRLFISEKRERKQRAVQ